MHIRNGEQILDMMRAYQIPCLLAAAADLDLFEKLTPAPRTASEVAAAASCNLRAVTILLDALASVGVIIKQDEQYSISPELAPFLCEIFPQSVIAMLRHQANCLRNWSRLRVDSIIEGELAEKNAGAMYNDRYVRSRGRDG